MSEPITLYDADGNKVIMYSPMVAQFAVESGKLFTVRPVKIAVVANGVIYHVGVDDVTLDMRADVVDGITVATLCRLLTSSGEVLASTYRPIGYEERNGTRTYYFPDLEAEYIEIAPDVGSPSPWALDGMPQEDEAPHAILGSITVGGSDQYAGETLTAKRGRPRKVTGQIL